MEAYTIQKFVHRSPRKLRLVADMIRYVEPNKALELLSFTPNYGAKDLSAAIKTALANASQSGLNDGGVYFKAIEINGAAMMKRFRAGTRGRAKPYARRMSHIKIIISDDSNLRTQNHQSTVQKLNVKDKENLELAAQQIITGKEDEEKAQTGQSTRPSRKTVRANVKSSKR